MKANSNECPNCKTSQDVVSIVYGKPGPSLVEASQRGEVFLGGCCMGPSRFHCKKCLSNFP
jgi:hypothetical protein